MKSLALDGDGLDGAKASALGVVGDVGVEQGQVELECTLFEELRGEYMRASGEFTCL